MVGVFCYAAVVTSGNIVRNLHLLPKVLALTCSTLQVPTIVAPYALVVSSLRYIFYTGVRLRELLGANLLIVLRAA